MGFLSDIAGIAGSVIGGAVGGPFGAAVGGSIGSAITGASASRDAARAQQRASDASIAEQQRQFDLIRGDTAPARQIGTSAINELSRLFGYPTEQPQAAQQNFSQFAGLPFGLGSALQQRFPQQQQQQTQPSGPDMSVFWASPDYNFRRSEGNRGIERTAAARGGAFSGNALRALTEFNSGLASQEFGDFFNRRAGLAGLGQTATGQSGLAGLRTADNVGNALMAGGDARASGILGQANTINNSLGSILNAYLYRSGGGGGGGSYYGRGI